MEFRDLKYQYRLHKKEIDSAIQNILTDTNFIQGKQVSELEKLLAEYVGVKHCITCANGTDALQLALMTWNIGAGDAVFVPDFTFFSSGEVVPLVGATPIFVDIDEDTYNINPQRLDQAIQYVLEKTNLKPRVVIAVDLFGQPADFKQIKETAEKYNLLILEDGAQGFGGSIETKKACSFGDIATTSFFPVKVPVVKERLVSSWAQYTICFQNNEQREQAIKKLKENDIPTAVYYRKPMHRQSAFIENKNIKLDYTVTEKICERCLSLPMHSYLSVDEIKKIIKKVKQIHS